MRGEKYEKGPSWRGKKKTKKKKKPSPGVGWKGGGGVLVGGKNKKKRTCIERKTGGGRCERKKMQLYARRKHQGKWGGRGPLGEKGGGKKQKPSLSPVSGDWIGSRSGALVGKWSRGKERKT